MEFSLKLRGARSRLYRRRFLQVNTRWKALAEIHTMHSFAPFSMLNILFKNRCYSRTGWFAGLRSGRDGGVGPGPGHEVLEQDAVLPHLLASHSCCRLHRRSGKLYRARSRLYRGQILQVNMRLKALAEIYAMHSFAPFWNRIPKTR